MYLGGTASGVNLSKEEEVLSLSLVFPGSANTVFAAYNMASCSGASSLRARLDSSGNIIEANGTLNQSFGILESFWRNLTGQVTAVSSSNFVSPVDTSIRPDIFSLTMKPDTQKVYGLLAGGQIVEMDIVSDVYSVPSPCPFNVTNCQVPEWMQSISAGKGTDLFSIDHSGNVYLIEGSNPVDLVQNVGPHTQQISFY